MTVQPFAFPVFDPAGRKAMKAGSQVKVLMSEGMHDTAVITVRGAAQDTPELQPGTPVQMQYGWQPSDLDWFYGYVDHIETHYDWNMPDTSHLEDVVCLGVSYTMKDPFIGAWSNIPASSLVQQIAQQHFLSSLIETGDYAWPSIGSTGCTTWQFLNQLADKIGYTLACNQSNLRFVSIDTGMAQQMASMPIFRTRNTAATMVDQTISSFQALQGDALPLDGQDKAVRLINGLDLSSGQIIGATNDATGSNSLGATSVYPFFYQQVSDTVVPNQGAAVATLDGLTQTNRWAYRAEATLGGYTGVKQGMPIVLSGIDSNQDGVWWVQEVCHRITAYLYALDVVLGRDSLGSSTAWPQQGLQVAYTPTNPYSYVAVNVPPTVLVNNRWRAQNSSVAYVNAPG